MKELKDIMKELKERFKEIKVPALTKNDWILRMFFYNDKFDKKFYSLLFDLTKYLEFDANKRGYEYHFNIRHSQRFVNTIDTKSEYSFEAFKLAITKEYIGTIIESEVEDNLRLNVLLTWDAGLEKDKEYQAIAQNLYNSYCLNIAINKFKSQSPISIFSTEVNYAAPIRFGETEKKEEEKKDMSIKIEIKENKTYNNVAEKNRFSEVRLEKMFCIEEDFHGAKPGCSKALRERFGNIKIPKNGLPTVKQIYSNKKKGVTIVEFANGDKVRITREKDDKDDVEKAVAIAMVKYAWGLDKYFDALEKVVDSSKKSVIKKKPEKKETKEKTEQPLTKEEEQKKVLKTLNKKEINIEYLKLYKNYEEYCEAQEKWLIRKDLWLTEKEFDLLKKYFK